MAISGPAAIVRQLAEQVLLDALSFERMARAPWTSDGRAAFATRLVECPSYGSSVSLVVDGGLQFLDFELAPGAVEATFGRFAEDNDAIGGSSQPMLFEVLLEDGTAIHPVTRQPVDPASTYRVSGLDSLRSFMGSWVPVPFLRSVGRHPGGETRYDEGPMNWVRAQVLDVASPAGAPPRFRLVLLVDTRIEHEARSPDLVYNVPCKDDVRFQSAFSLVDRADDVAWLLGEEWLERWLHDVSAGPAAADAGAGVGAELAASRFSLAHIARYLVFLRVLKAAAGLPEIRFLDTVSPRTRVVADEVDLVVDIGHRQAVAIVAEVDARGGHADPSSARLLARRDLSRPQLVYSGIFPSRVEFHRATFGNEALSRRTGRAEAFEWPSVVRVGEEAQRLGELAVGQGEATGHGLLRQGLLDTSPAERPWRFSTAAALAARGPMVSGQILTLLSETGEPLTRASRLRDSVPRPRFSHSSLVTLFLAEIIVQAVSAINSPSYSGRATAAAVPRRIRRLVLPASVVASAEEEAMLLQRARAAVDLAYASLGSSTGRNEPRPEVVLGVDGAVAAQLVVLVDQVEHKLRRPVRELFDLCGRTRPALGTLPSLRIASIELGAVRTAVTAVTYALGDDGGLRPTLQVADGCDYGADDVLDAVAQRVVMPALQRALSAAGIEDTRGFLLALSGEVQQGAGAAPVAAVASLADQQVLRGLLEFVVRAAALGLLEHVTFVGSGSPHVPVTTALGELLMRQPLELSAIPRMFSDRVSAVAGRPFDLLDVTVGATSDGLKSIVLGAAMPLVQTLTELVAGLECDMVHLAGGGTTLPFIEDAILSGLPFRPDRVVKLSEYTIGAWYPFKGVGRRVLHAKTLPVTGVLVAERIVQRQAPFGLDLNRLAETAPSRSGLLQALRRPGEPQSAATEEPRGVRQPRLAIVSGDGEPRRVVRGDGGRGGR